MHTNAKLRTKYWSLPPFIAITVLAPLAIPVQLAGQGQNKKLPRYSVTDLGTLGVTFSTELD